jgi:hypothetical protein
MSFLNEEPPSFGGSSLVIGSTGRVIGFVWLIVFGAY